jgi:hypothetical protein
MLKNNLNMTEQDILEVIKKDKWMMNILCRAEKLNMPNWVIGAGFVRNKIWDYLHGNSKPYVDTADIDMIYFDPDGNDEEKDNELSKKLRSETGVDWEVVNITYSHEWDNVPPHTSVETVLAHWPETASSVGIKIENGELKLIAPYGIDDLVRLIIRRSPKTEATIERVKERMKEKKWLEKWPNLKLVE